MSHSRSSTLASASGRTWFVCYWVAQLIVDVANSVVAMTIIWAVFLAPQILLFIDNFFNMWYTFVMAGPSFITSPAA
jgi:hypothetical protein